MSETAQETIARLRRERDELRRQLDNALVALTACRADYFATLGELATARATIPPVIAARDAALADVFALRSRCHDLERYEAVIHLCATDLRPLIDCVAEMAAPVTVGA
jgi:hypothetical protein